MTEPYGGGAGMPRHSIDLLRQRAETLREPMVEFTRRLVAIPSLPGEEGQVAETVANEMRALGYDEVYIDPTGNVIGLIRATALTASGSIMFNTHMDQVDVGDPGRWPYPPFAGTVVDGEIWGRGTSDLKGSLACHVYAGALLKASRVPLPNDVYVTGVVQEEIGGHGAAMLADELHTDVVVVGEPSANRLALGHRGKIRDPRDHRREVSARQRTG
jgi:succinyl-diaminopimelate desuccinylase